MYKEFVIDDIRFQFNEKDWKEYRRAMKLGWVSKDVLNWNECLIYCTHWEII